MAPKAPLLRLFPVLVLNIVELGIALPILPALALALGATPLDVGLLYTVQALGQFVMAPAWGAISDRFGRKQTLIATFVLAAVAEVATAFATSLIALYIARIFVGLCAGNIATATALIADVTDESDRSKGMAMVGISFGLGFTIGPALGAGISYFAAGDLGPLGVGAPFLVAGLLSIFTAIIAIFLVWEPSLSPQEREARRGKRPSLKAIISLSSRRELTTMFSLFLLYALAASILEGTFFLFLEAEYGFDEVKVGLIFAGFGILMAFTQGGVGHVSKRIGNRAMLVAGGVVLGGGLLASAFVVDLTLFLILIATATIGRAFVHPGILSITSTRAQARSETGQIMGVLQSSSSLGRIAGPALGGFLFEHVSHHSPFATAGIVMLGAILLWAIFDTRA